MDGNIFQFIHSTTTHNNTHHTQKEAVLDYSLPHTHTHKRSTNVVGICLFLVAYNFRYSLLTLKNKKKTIGTLTQNSWNKAEQ